MVLQAAAPPRDEEQPVTKPWVSQEVQLPVWTRAMVVQAEPEEDCAALRDWHAS